MTHASRPPLAAILCGPTASGKTALAVALAARLPIEVISADSRQAYRRLDIGTAKPTAAERAAVSHHWLDVLDLNETPTAARFAQDARRLAAEIRGRGRIPLIVGGAGFYLHVLRAGLFEPPYDAAALSVVRREIAGWSLDTVRAELAARDPERARALHPNDAYRLRRALEICIAAGESVSALTRSRVPPEDRFVELRLAVQRAALHARIAARARAMLDAGWIDEVAALLKAGFAPDLPGLRALGYPHVVAHLQGAIDRARLLELVERDTRRFVRHQETWFRKQPGAQVLDPTDSQVLERLVDAVATAS